MRPDIGEMGDTELLRKHKIVTEYLADILSEISTRKLKIQDVKSNFPQHLSSDEIKTSETKKSDSVKISLKRSDDEKDSDKNCNKVDDLTRNDLKLVLDENKIAYKASDKKEVLIELVRKHHLVRQAIKYKNLNNNLNK